MTTYSSFFASGLLAPIQTTMDVDMARAYTPGPPSSPMLAPLTPLEPVDRSYSLTPTPAHKQLHPSSAMLQQVDANSTRQDGRPRLRKRKSSLSMTASPMSGIKSPSRNAGNALQRIGFLSPSRSRSGSMNEYGLGVASEETSIAGRMRSGSVGGLFNLKPRRVLRKASAPAPTAPLPALPPAAGQLPPVPKIQLLSSPPLITIPQPRRPLSHRFHTSDNHYALHTHTNITRSHSHEGISSMSLAMAGSGFLAGPPTPVSPLDRDLGMGMAIDEEMKEN